MSSERNRSWFGKYSSTHGGARPLNNKGSSSGTHPMYCKIVSEPYVEKRSGSRESAKERMNKKKKKVYGREKQEQRVGGEKKRRRARVSEGMGGGEYVDARRKEPKYAYDWEGQQPMVVSIPITAKSFEPKDLRDLIKNLNEDSDDSSDDNTASRGKVYDRSVSRGEKMAKAGRRIKEISEKKFYDKSPESPLKRTRKGMGYSRNNRSKKVEDVTLEVLSSDEEMKQAAAESGDSDVMPAFSLTSVQYGERVCRGSVLEGRKLEFWVDNVTLPVVGTGILIPYETITAFKTRLDTLECPQCILQMRTSHKMEGVDNGEESSTLITIHVPEQRQDFLGKLSRVLDLHPCLKEIHKKVSLKDLDPYTMTSSSGRVLRSQPKIPSEDEELILYPSVGRGRIRVTRKDIYCLEPSEFLNDTIIDFYMKYILRERLGEMSDKVYIFTTFFWSTYCTQGFDAVKNWTRSVDLFTKNFVVIPINANTHWSVVIICYPWRVAMEGKEAAASEKASILWMDSMALRPRHISKNVRKYLDQEWKAKYPFATRRVCSAQQLPLVIGSVPEQKNYSDCGVYVLHYVELFLSSPPSSIQEMAGEEKKTWFKKKAISKKRKEIKDIIMALHTQERERRIRDSLARQQQIEQNMLEKSLENSVMVECVEIGNSGEDKDGESTQVDESSSCEESEIPNLANEPSDDDSSDAGSSVDSNDSVKFIGSDDGKEDTDNGNGIESN